MITEGKNKDIVLRDDPTNVNPTDYNDGTIQGSLAGSAVNQPEPVELWMSDEISVFFGHGLNHPIAGEEQKINDVCCVQYNTNEEIVGLSYYILENGEKYISLYTDQVSGVKVH